MSSETVLSIEELRRELARILTRMRTHPEEIVTIGRQRRPEAVLVPIPRWAEIIDAMAAREDTASSAAPDRPSPGTAPAAPGGLDAGDLHWDPRDGVALEVAEAVLGGLISACVAKMAELEQASIRDEEALGAWRDRVTRYAQERRQLRISEPATLHDVVERYGRELRELTGRPAL